MATVSFDNISCVYPGAERPSGSIMIGDRDACVRPEDLSLVQYGKPGLEVIGDRVTLAPRLVDCTSSTHKPACA